MKTYIVVENRKTDYPDPVILKKGQRVVVDKTEIVDEPEWQGWVWCVTENNAGWVPEQILNIQDDNSEPEVKEDYSAKELDIDAGEIVKGERELNSWLWCLKENADWGWVPLRNIEFLK